MNQLDHLRGMSYIPRVSNNKCRPYVTERKQFQGSNLYGIYPINDVYTVYSYGDHFPLFIYTEGRWFENSDGYSSSTTRHKSHTRPTATTNTTLLPTDHMRHLASHGYQSLAKERVMGNAPPDAYWKDVGTYHLGKGA